MNGIEQAKEKRLKWVMFVSKIFAHRDILNDSGRVMVSKTSSQKFSDASKGNSDPKGMEALAPYHHLTAGPGQNC